MFFFFIESRCMPTKNYEQSLIYKTLKLPLIHKSKKRKSWSYSEKSRKCESLL